MKIFKLGLIAVFILSTAITVHATKIREIEVTGSGLTRQEAIYAGLIEAVRQVNGVKVASETRTNFKYKEFATSRDNVQTQGTEGENSINKGIYSKSNGFIEKYEILDSEQGNNNWEVKLLVSIPQYKTPGLSPNNRRKLAVVPFKTSRLSYTSGNRRMPAAELSTLFAQKLVTQFTQTRKFTILDREYYLPYLKEKHLILSGDAPVSEQMKIGEVLGVDYLVVGSITEADSRINEYTIQVTGETKRKCSGQFIADYRIIAMATRQIKWSDTVNVRVDNEGCQYRDGDSSGQVGHAVLARAADVLVGAAMDNIYPLRVATVQTGGQFVLNQGGKGLNEGLMLNVFRRGEKIKDVYTKESLGAAESWIGTAKIIRVTAKTAYAMMVEGDSNVLKGDVCRRVPPKETVREEASKATDVLVPENGGGVVLPFD